MTDDLLSRMHAVMQISGDKPANQTQDQRDRIEKSCGRILDDELRRIEIATGLDSLPVSQATD